MFTDYEAFDTDFNEMQELLTLSVKDTIESEARENAQSELEQLANDIEASFGESEEELIENLRFTAEMNPISETAFDLRDEAFQVLR